MATHSAKARAASLARFAARCDAGKASLRDPRFRPSQSPALNAAIADVEDHARRWVAARVETNRELGRTEAPARDTRLDLYLAPAAVRSPTGALL
ncbi:MULTISPECIES: hypothetical protein [unclassified Methylobacterium]|jgi:hypothetical protein|uniref:hypothetical protein n=1 Tax=unclassified Methylobacterium TaxID=2615210 RepID=UPI0005B8999A|nr:MULTISPECIES: hypothetical protein [unclassified Methylobacterium]SFV11815.1 hypothetical protein SAMN02799643_05572 [Methylobacterium sp. UNCCL125]